MHINRLFEIVYILLNKKIVTAQELSEHFEVSRRTIYRDIDELSSSGIPIYTNKGKGGGISLLDNYVFNKSILSDKEQIDIISSLQGLSALDVPDIEPVLNKLAVMFQKNNSSWIDVDFSHWGSSLDEREKFNLFKTSILNRNVVFFDYFSSYGEKTSREVEPLKLLFKSHGWYIYGYCRVKNDYRMFKVTRIKNPVMLEEKFKRDIPDDIQSSPQDFSFRMIKLVIKIDSVMAYRIYDEFDRECIEKNQDGSFTVTAIVPEDEWIYRYVMSYGNNAEVLEPQHIRDNVKIKLEEGLKKYS